MKRVAIITGPGFQDEEFIYPYYRFLEANAEVEVATSTGQDVFGKYGVPARATCSASKLVAIEFDAVFIPGGFEAPDRVRTDKDVLKFIREMNEGKKLVAAICHGPWVLISAGIVEGRKMTGYISIKDDIVNAGAEYLDAEVVVDGNLITAPHYRNNPVFMEKVISSLLK